MANAHQMLYMLGGETMSKEQVYKQLIRYSLLGIQEKINGIDDVTKLDEIYKALKQILDMTGFKGKWALEHRLEGIR